MNILAKQCSEFCKWLDMQDGEEKLPEITLCVESELWVQPSETLSLGLSSLL